MGRKCDRYGENRNRVLVGKPEKKGHFEDLTEDDRIVLKCILKK
jgi:hypothetical protein